MRFLLINGVCGIRSTGRICTDLATALEEEGHEVKIAYGREFVPEQFQKYAVRIGTNLDNKTHGLKARLLDGSGFGSSRATVEFIKWVKKYDPDVIHLHNLHGYYINIDLLFDYLRNCGKIVIWTLHDCWAFTGHSAYCDAASCEKWKTGCDHCPELGIYPKSFIDRSNINWARKKNAMQGIPNLRIITPSNWLAGLVRESFLSEYPVTVIHNGIDTSQFCHIESDFRERYSIGRKFMLLGVSTSWDDMKGLSDFIELSNRLGDTYQLVLVGVSSDQKKNLPKSIIAIEKTNSINELASIYSSADLFLNLSYCENYPTVNLEAMACNTPVLTYHTGGSPESVVDHCGIIVDRGNVDAAIEAIKEYRANFTVRPNLNLDISVIDKKATVSEYLDIINSGLVAIAKSSVEATV